jgi:hypothetical protein
MRATLSTACLCFLLAVIGLSLAVSAAQKPFWFDEILTLDVARCAPGPAMWHAMTAGFEFNPPGSYVATWAAEKVFGRGPVSSRLPPIIAGVIVCLCAFRLAARWNGPSAGFWAVFLVVASGLRPYFYEARGYALVMAGALVSWVCWQGMPEDTRYRRLRITGISAGLILALASHMWALLIPACFAAGEIARWLRTGIRDRAVWIAIVSPELIALSYRPLIAASKGVWFGGANYNNGLYGSYLAVLGGLPVLGTACALVLIVGCLLTGTGAPQWPRKTRPVEDTVLAVCFCAVPAAIWAVTKVMHSAFMPRYGLVAAPALAFLLAQLPGLFGGWTRRASLALLLLAGLAFSGNTFRAAAAGETWRGPHPWRTEFAELRRVATDAQPIVLTGVDMLQMDFYAEPSLAKRFLYVADRPLAIRLVDTDGVDSAFVLGRDYLNLRGPIVSYRELRRNYKSFWLVRGPYELVDWISLKLSEDGADVQSVAGTQIFHVRFAEMPQS